MKKGWKTKTLEEACQFSNGLWKGEKPPFVNVGVIRNTNFTKDGTLDDSDIAYLDVEAKKLEKRRLQFGDIILEKSGGGPKQPVGRVALFDKDEGDFSFSNFTAALRVLEPDDLDFRFLHKFLHWTYVSGVTEGMQSNSTGIRNLDGDAYKAIEITYPPLAEQQRIVGLLDEAFEGLATAKANAEKNLHNARALFESHLQSVFTQRGPGWVGKSLVDVCTFINGRAYKKDEMLSTGKYPLLRVGNFFTNRGWYYSDFELDADKYCDNGDLLYAWSASFGPRVWDGGKVIYHYHIWKVLPHEKVVEKRFLLHLLEWDVDEIKKAHGTGTTMMHVSKGSMEYRVVPIPPLKDQAAIVLLLDSLRKETQRLATLYERKQAALAALKQSLLHQAFTGEL